MVNLPCTGALIISHNLQKHDIFMNNMAGIVLKKISIAFIIEDR